MVNEVYVHYTRYLKNPGCLNPKLPNQLICSLFSLLGIHVLNTQSSHPSQQTRTLQFQPGTDLQVFLRRHQWRNYSKGRPQQRKSERSVSCQCFKLPQGKERTFSLLGSWLWQVGKTVQEIWYDVNTRSKRLIKSASEWAGSPGNCCWIPSCFGALQIS